MYSLLACFKELFNASIMHQMIKCFTPCYKKLINYFNSSVQNDISLYRKQSDKKSRIIFTLFMSRNAKT